MRRFLGISCQIRDVRYLLTKFQVDHPIYIAIIAVHFGIHFFFSLSAKERERDEKNSSSSTYVVYIELSYRSRIQRESTLAASFSRIRGASFYCTKSFENKNFNGNDALVYIYVYDIVLSDLLFTRRSQLYLLRVYGHTDALIIITAKSLVA